MRPSIGMRLSVLLVWSVIMGACGGPVATGAPQLSVAESMTRRDTSGFRVADAPRAFTFPADHGAHEGFAVEWWYFTGNLQSADGREFGYQFTLFRSAIQAERPVLASAWATNYAWMAHLAVSDISGQRFFADERFSREAIGIAGAQQTPWRIWLDDWQVFSEDADVRTMRVVASNADVALDFNLDSSQTPVLQGDAGLSQKSAGVGNASYYYSLTRMPTVGTLRIGTEIMPITGNSWMDREWSTSALAADQVGWDWFALHFTDGSDMMIYHLRRRDGTSDPYSGGSYRRADGQVLRLQSADITFQPQGSWQSPHTAAQYPATWQITVAPLDMQFTVTPALADQELQVTVRYWEGAVRVDGRQGAQPLTGVGYLEMTGYADR